MQRMFLLLVGCLLLSGCLNKADTSSPVGGKQANVVLPEVMVGSKQEYDALVAKQQGKVVLVDFWATWCGPCLEGFPHTVEIADKYRDQGLATIAVSLDSPDELPAVKEFLAAQHANFEQLVSKDGASSDSMDAFGLNASVPHYRLYDRTGKVRYDWDGLPDELEEKIQELLAEK